MNDIRDLIREVITGTPERYKVLQDYPGTVYNIDDTIHANSNDKFKDFPHLFRKLEWWEEISYEFMPKYVLKINEGGYYLKGDILEVYKWIIPLNNICSCDRTIKKMAHWCCIIDSSNTHHYNAVDVVPSSEEEYKKFKKKKQ